MLFLVGNRKRTLLLINSVTEITQLKGYFMKNGKIEIKRKEKV